MMIDHNLDTVESAAKSWREEAEERRRFSKSADPIADTLEYCAGELLTRIRTLAKRTAYETAEERAAREGVTPQTVRIWIRTNQLPATNGPKGYRIPRDAVRVRSPQ